ncbi:hypothetical protein [Antrihabitans sp. YC2-6]|uniref:hypothetical protein n=1 Tax=Antrihabitans sp. YC2-6 TaxID=2799498 RepID=UPI0018F6C583|nr:hypothetical protein [Antrihabitans sp. YC2-6]MBJ8343939.1 hypothetical protein [Antrihabitans sp. YC2-6]
MAYKQPATALLDFLRESYPTDTFKEFYEGDPGLIPLFNMPCIVVEKLGDQMGNGPSGMKKVTERLRVKVVFNKKDDFKADADPTDLTEKRIRDIVEARDPETGAYLPNTLKRALMDRFELNGQGIDQGIEFDLGIDSRPDGSMTQEGHLIVSITYLVDNAFHS